MAAFVVLMLVVGQHLLSQYGPRKAPRKQQIERGTSDSDDVDFEWIPKETLREVMSMLLSFIYIFIHSNFFEKLFLKSL